MGKECTGVRMVRMGMFPGNGDSEVGKARRSVG